jgi:hypothetical protein
VRCTWDTCPLQELQRLWCAAPGDSSIVGYRDFGALHLGMRPLFGYRDFGALHLGGVHCLGTEISVRCTWGFVLC